MTTVFFYLARYTDSTELGAARTSEVIGLLQKETALSTDNALCDPQLIELIGQIDPIRDHARQIAGSMTTEQLVWRHLLRNV